MRGVGGVNLVLLNIRHGGGVRATSLLSWLNSLSTDIIILAEWRDNAAGTIIKQGLESTGFFVTATAATGTRRNGILIAAAHPFECRRATPPGVSKGELLLAEVSSGYRLLGAYFPQGSAKVPFFNECFLQAKNSENIPFLIIGDLNTGRNDVDIEGNGVRFACADMFEALHESSGLVDLWRREHGQDREWSWRSHVNGFRIDHAFANRAFEKCFSSITCVYDHSPRENKLTDHSALILRCASE
jgi:exonuclease III